MPNLQNISRNALRECIVPAPGYIFLAIDASQIELRVAALLSKDPLMLSALKTEDLHLTTAIQVFGWTEDKEEMKERRYKAKTLNFAILYGADSFTIATLIDCSVSEAQELLDQYFAEYVVLYNWMVAVVTHAREDGYVVNIFGRIRPLPDIKSSVWKIREKGEKEAVNSIIQSEAVDVVKLMMLYLRKKYISSIHLVLQIHDEMIWEVPETLLEECIVSAKKLTKVFVDFPVKITKGYCYGKLEEII